MAQILKPSNLSLTWASGGDVLDPGNTKYATGWQVEIPPRQWFNYLDNRQDTAIAHFNQHGIPVWDSGTEYQADKSYTQGPTNGTIYRCVQTHINQNPETDVTNTYWIIAFASAGDFYTKAEVDGAFLSKAANGSDIANSATFRNNISVYSQAQTYTKTEVDAKTTVSSTAQSQALASNATLITPLRLAEAFQGVNQSPGDSGFQRLPGGLLMQWGSYAADGTSDPVTITFPIAFSSRVVNFNITAVGGSTPVTAWRGATITLTGTTAQSTSQAGGFVMWLAIGF